jgi:RHS repeat-associated protein
VLVAQTSDSTTTRYAQDLASPLSQVLQIGTTNYLYGMERLAAQTGSARVWYGADALGSVRQTLDAAGVPQATTSDDPWGQVQQGAAPVFGFAGELQDTLVDNQLVYLRARWYHTGSGMFTSVDPFAGFAAQPYSLHPYQYAYSNPVRWTDPSGFMICTDGEICRLGREMVIFTMMGIASQIYDKGTWGCALRTDDGIFDTDTIDNLWMDYICEFGPRDRVFGQHTRLTKELAQTQRIANMRAQFYAQNGQPLTSDIGDQMNPSGFGDAKVLDVFRTGQPITITDFLGGFNSWSVTRQQSASGQDVVRFEIYNETTLASGTRIGFKKEGTEELSYLRYYLNPAPYNRDGSSVVDTLQIDTSRYSLITVLSAKESRNPDNRWGTGGGTMTQRFVWEEPYDPCYSPGITPPIWMFPRRVTPLP